MLHAIDRDDSHNSDPNKAPDMPPKEPILPEEEEIINPDAPDRPSARPEPDPVDPPVEKPPPE